LSSCVPCLSLARSVVRLHSSVFGVRQPFCLREEVSSSLPASTPLRRRIRKSRPKIFALKPCGIHSEKKILPTNYRASRGSLVPWAIFGPVWGWGLPRPGGRGPRLGGLPPPRPWSWLIEWGPYLGGASWARVPARFGHGGGAPRPGAGWGLGVAWRVGTRRGTRRGRPPRLGWWWLTRRSLVPPRRVGVAPSRSVV